VVCAYHEWLFRKHGLRGQQPMTTEAGKGDGWTVTECL
jgi:hypothetical protein